MVTWSTNVMSPYKKKKKTIFKIQRPKVNHIVFAKDMGSVTFLFIKSHYNNNYYYKAVPNGLKKGV